MWVEMLNSNQALMETNLQGAVAVAIVTAAKLETQTWLLLDSFGAPACRWCQGRGSRRARVTPGHGEPEAGSNSAVPHVLLRSVPPPTRDGKSRSEPVQSNKCRDWQGQSRAWLRHKGQNAQAMSWGLSTWCQTREVGLGWGAAGMLWWDAG